jgi:nuclear pore complex protein Nup62
VLCLADAATPAFGSLFGPKPATTATTMGAGNTVAAPSTTLAGTNIGTTTASTAVAAVPPSALRGKSVEEIVNKWQEELETQRKEFRRTAQEIEVWDRALIENSVQV